MQSVVLPFDRCALFVSLRPSTQPSVQVKDEIMDWLRAHNSEVPDDRLVQWLLNGNYREWKVLFRFLDSKTAVLFKLTFAGS